MFTLCTDFAGHDPDSNTILADMCFEGVVGNTNLFAIDGFFTDSYFNLFIAVVDHWCNQWHQDEPVKYSSRFTTMLTLKDKVFEAWHIEVNLLAYGRRMNWPQLHILGAVLRN